MADDPSTPAAQESNPQPDNPNSQSNQPDSIPVSTPPPSSTPTPVNPNPNPPLVSLPPPPPPPPSVSYSPQPVSTSVAFAVPPAAPSFRPVPQFSPILNYQNPGVPPPGVSSGAPMAPGAPLPVPVPQHMMHYQMQPMRPYAPMPNGYSAPPQGTIPPPGGFLLLFAYFMSIYYLYCHLITNFCSLKLYTIFYMLVFIM